MKCNDICSDERLTHHYREHVNEEIRKKNENLGEETSGSSPSKWQNGKYVFDKEKDKYRCLLCKSLFHISGTGTHWHSHFRRGETKLPNIGAYKKSY